MCWHDLTMVKDVRLANDYGCEFPLWDEGGTSPEDWPMLSARLTQALIDWHQHFMRHFDHRTGWTGGSVDRYREQGVILARDLQRELGEEYRVFLDPWPG